VKAPDLSSLQLEALAHHVRKLVILTDDRPAVERLLDTARYLEGRAVELREIDAAHEAARARR
jgi:hypothetical protein